MRNPIVLVVVVVVIALLGYSLLNRGSGAEGTEADYTSTATTTDTAQVQGERFNGTFAQLAGRTGSWKCTIDTSAASTTVTGTSYVSNGKVRADMTMQTPQNGVIETHMISDGTYAYTWSSMMPQGIKMKITTDQSGMVANAGKSGQGLNANSSYAYRCDPWTVDASLFVVPTTINFMTLPQQ